MTGRAPNPPPPETLIRRRIYLLRHGEVSYFDDRGTPVDPRRVSLTAAGRRQAATAADALADVPLDRAVCSGLARTRETAEIVVGARSLTIEDAAEFHEIRAGRFRDVPAHRLEAELAHAFDRAGEAGARFVGGEGFGEFRDRVLDGWTEMLGRADWRHLLMVGHDAVNRVLLCWAVGADLSAIAGFEQDMCCLNIIDVDMRGRRVERALVKAMNVTPDNVSKLGMTLTTMEQVHFAYRPGNTDPTDGKGGR